MATAPRPLLLAVELDGDGAHPAARLHSGRPRDAALDGRALRALAGQAEAAGFALVTFADSPVPPPGHGPDGPDNPPFPPPFRLEAGTRAAYLATATEAVGLAPTLHATVTEPFHLATQLASLDHASHGRAAWVVGAAATDAETATVGTTPLTGDALRRELADVIDVARLLWDSWEDDAVIRDAAAGRYLDADKVHHVDFTGVRFSVKGPLITPRPPQGRPLVLAADALGVSDRADAVLVGGADTAEAAARAAQARGLGAPRVLVEVEALLDSADRTAAERLAELDSAAPGDSWPRTDRLRYVGPPAGLAEWLSGLAARADVDGVRLHPAVLAVDLPVLAEQVLPALGPDGVRRPQPGATLHDAFGLPRPPNHFAATTATAAAAAAALAGAAADNPTATTTR